MEIIDPVEEMKPVRKVIWKPPADDNRFWKPLNPTEHPLYNETPALTFTYHTKFIQSKLRFEYEGYNRESVVFYL